MYKISPSVYEKADPALLELIERAQVCNFTDEELARYEAGLKSLEDLVDFKEMLEEGIARGRAEGHRRDGGVRPHRQGTLLGQDAEVLHHPGEL